jgi:hypothetical protein
MRAQATLISVSGQHDKNFSATLPGRRPATQ